MTVLVSGGTAEGRKEATEWMQTCGAAEWQFSAGKEDLNHMLHSHTEVCSSILGHCHSFCTQISKIDALYPASGKEILFLAEHLNTTGTLPSSCFDSSCF